MEKLSTVDLAEEMFGNVATNHGCIINHNTDDNHPKYGCGPTGVIKGLRLNLPVRHRNPAPIREKKVPAKVPALIFLTGLKLVKKDMAGYFRNSNGFLIAF
jgi:hypothetical protein